MNKKSRAQSGYSLTEALVVLAIVGMISVISIPQFLTFYRQSRIKASMRTLTSDIRLARQRAVSRHQLARLSFSLDATRGFYQLYDGTTSGGTTTWTPVWDVPRELQETVVFYESVALPTYADEDSPTDGLRDIQFNPNGTIGDGSSEGNVYLRFNGDLDVPITQYQITLKPTGMLSVTGSKI